MKSYIFRIAGRQFYITADSNHAAYSMLVADLIDTGLLEMRSISLESVYE